MVLKDKDQIKAGMAQAQKRADNKRDIKEDPEAHTIPESVLFTVILMDDIPHEIGNKIWARSITLRDYRLEQKKKKDGKFKLSDDEIRKLNEE